MYIKTSQHTYTVLFNSYQHERIAQFQGEYHVKSHEFVVRVELLGYRNTYMFASPGGVRWSRSWVSCRLKTICNTFTDMKGDFSGIYCHSVLIYYNLFQTMFVSYFSPVLGTLRDVICKLQNCKRI